MVFVPKWYVKLLMAARVVVDLSLRHRVFRGPVHSEGFSAHERVCLAYNDRNGIVPRFQWDRDVELGYNLIIESPSIYQGLVVDFGIVHEDIHILESLVIRQLG